MKKSRGYSTTMNYLSGVGGGGGGSNDIGSLGDDHSGDELADYHHNYHNYPTATRDYSMRGANSAYPSSSSQVLAPTSSSSSSRDYRGSDTYGVKHSKDYRSDVYHDSTKNYIPSSSAYHGSSNYLDANGYHDEYQPSSSAVAAYHNATTTTTSTKDYHHHQPRDYGSLGRSSGGVGYRHDATSYHLHNSTDDYHHNNNRDYHHQPIHDRGGGGSANAYSTGPRTRRGGGGIGGGGVVDDYHDRRPSTSSAIVTSSYQNYHDRPTKTSTSGITNYHHQQDYRHHQPQHHDDDRLPRTSTSTTSSYHHPHHQSNHLDYNNDDHLHNSHHTHTMKSTGIPATTTNTYQKEYNPVNYQNRPKTTNSTSNYPTEYRTSPRHRYRNAEDYHYDYRGGYRPGLDQEGYTTDGSGSGYRDGSSIHSGGGGSRGYENYRYPESEELLPRHHRNMYYQQNGDTYPRAILRKSKGDGGGGEKTPFLGGSGGEPVRLTPSWENSNLPKEELNFRNLGAFETFEVEADPPKDRYRLVFLTLVLHGVGTLMPWNMYITAKNYFVDYKLRSEDGELSTYSTNFLTYIGYASHIPSVVFNWLNIFMQMGGNLTTRIVWSIGVEVVVFVFTVIMAMIDSSEWVSIFFWITIASVVILNTANGIYQNTVFGMAAQLPFSYTGAVILGSNISGTFTAIINIMAIAMAPNIRTSAIYYFITALFVLLACFDSYFALPLNRFYRFHESQHERAKRAGKREAGRPRVPYWHVFKKAFPQLFNVFMVFFVTLAVFPAVLADTCRTEENFPVSAKYFQAVTCFLTFNLFAMLGNMLPGLFTWPGPRFLVIPVLLRLLFIPAFLLCHFYPVKVTRIMPVLIDSDWAFWVLVMMLGLTSGYYSSLAMMYCPRTVEPEYAPVAGMMGAASLITGIFTGVIFQMVCTVAVTNITFEIPGYDFPMRNCTVPIS